MDIYINKIHYPVNNLGAGTRLGIWFQGCPIRCPGCVNPDTWEAAEEYRLDYTEFINTLVNFENLQAADGVTITGGEPFAQPEALFELTRFLRNFI
ncbi:MAG TPA: 4Fe-4S cluster-binding domain-containing protein, partial [Candidatus Wallbacteria bacterium]|nr:4Fe-4S cluster-binding domain-containing protein [Candidatus Wallbacteria bacterium]